jgi:hypothetical protein
LRKPFPCIKNIVRHANRKQEMKWNKQSRTAALLDSQLWRATYFEAYGGITVSGQSGSCNLERGPCGRWNSISNPGTWAFAISLGRDISSSSGQPQGLRKCKAGCHEIRGVLENAAQRAGTVFVLTMPSMQLKRDLYQRKENASAETLLRWRDGPTLQRMRSPVVYLRRP